MVFYDLPVVESSMTQITVFYILSNVETGFVINICFVCSLRGRYLILCTDDRSVIIKADY